MVNTLFVLFDKEAINSLMLPDGFRVGLGRINSCPFNDSKLVILNRLFWMPRSPFSISLLRSRNLMCVPFLN